MHQKPLFLAIAVIILVAIAGVFWSVQKRQGAMSQPVVTEPVAEAPVQPEPEKYPQHIETIPGNTDEVWYNIPELGIRMRLNKEFAEDLIYVQDSPSSVYFSTEKLSQISPCLPIDGPLGALFRAEGNMLEVAKTDEYLAARVSGYVQVGGYYYGWTGPHEACWDLEGKLGNLFPIKYNGAGIKTVSGSVKTIEPLN